VNRQSERPDASREPRPRQSHNRPLQAIGSLVLACAAAVSVNLYGIPLSIKTVPGLHRAGIDTTLSILTGHLITLGGSLAFVVFGLISTFAWARWARTGFERLVGISYGPIIRFILIVVGICIVVVITLSMLGFHVEQLVLGGTVTAVLVTIAAQQALSNLFAGMLLQIAQPFKVGDSVWLRSGTLGGVLEGVVSDISITYVALESDDGRILVPNSLALAAAVSPVRSARNAGLLTSRFGRSTPRPPMAPPDEQAQSHGDAQDDGRQGLD
jgi:small-conductance mechanosensitive channel